MGYRIKYEGDMVKTTIQSSMSKQAKCMICIAVSLCAVIMLLSVTNSLNTIKEWLLPGDAKVTEAALNTLVEDLKQGDSLDDAITAFCQEILDHANIPR